MVEADPFLHNRGILRWRIASRFRNPGGFLNYALRNGRLRRPGKSGRK